MNFLLSVIMLLLFAFAHLEELPLGNEEQQERETFPVAVISVAGNETTIPEVDVGGLSDQTLSELHDVAKTISHSKGIYRETKKESVSEDELQIRRSILKKVAVASESDAMKDILQAFNDDENKIHLLEQMEYLVHQYDVAVNFATQGGIAMVAPLLFSSDDQIVSLVASVLGAAMQSNPTTQMVALKHNIGGSLLKLVSHPSPVALSRILFALACLLRNAPEAQEEFISLDGISKLAGVLLNDQISTNTKLKVVNLFSDLAVEQQTAELYPSDPSSAKLLKLKRLFASEMQKWEICKLMPSFLDFEDFDTHQKIVSAMASVHSSCRKDFQNENISNRLKKLVKIYDPDFEGEIPLYPVIDKDLKRALHSDLQALVKEISKETRNKSIKTEL